MAIGIVGVIFTTPLAFWVYKARQGDWSLVLGSLPVGHGDAAPTGPAPTAVAPAATAPHRSRRRRSPWSVGVAVVGAAAVAYGLATVATAEHSTVFGSGTVQVSEPGAVDVGMLFGSYEVVVPDDALVRTSGTVVFGSTECDVACSPDRTGPVIDVDATGAFGSVRVVTRTEAAQDG